MKLQLNKKHLIIISGIVLTAAIFLVAAQSGFCAEEVASHTPDIQQALAAQEKSDAIAKFIIAMAGVMLSSFVIFLGLSIYNKFFADKSLFPNNGPDDILNTPKSVDEAITLFIKRNKLC